MFQANFWEDWGFLLKEFPSVETWCSGLTQYTWPCYKFEDVSEKAFRQHLFISNRYKICLLGLSVYSFIPHIYFLFLCQEDTLLYHFDWDFLVFDYLVFFDGKEVIRFGRRKGDFFFSRVYSKACMPIRRWSHHLIVQIDRAPMTLTIYSIYRTIGLYLTESLWLSQSRGNGCLLFFGSCGMSWDVLSLKILFLALLKERKNLIFGEVLWPLNACFSEMELTLVFPLGFGLGKKSLWKQLLLWFFSKWKFHRFQTTCRWYVVPEKGLF